MKQMKIGLGPALAGGGTGRERVTPVQMGFVVAMFTIGSSVVLGLSNHAHQDAWIGALLGFAAAVPLLLVFVRLVRLYPGSNLFDVCTAVFGKVLGKAACALFIWYAFHVGFLVLREVTEFIQVRVFPDMPQTISLLAIAVLAIWICRRGVETLGRWAAVTLPIMLLLFVLFTVLLAKDLHLTNLLPVGEHISKVPQDMFQDFALPFAETVVCLGLMGAADREKAPAAGKALLWGVLLGFAMLFASLLRNAMALGAAGHSKWFPSYDATSLIIVGSFVSRIENIVGVSLLVLAFAKVSICLLVACKGLAGLFGAADYRPYAAPLGLLMAACAAIVYKSTPEVFEFLNVFPYYSLPFEVLLPVVLWVVAEIRNKRSKKEQSGKAPA